MLDLEDGTKEEQDNKLGSLIESRIPSSLTTPDPTQWKFQTVERTINSELLLPTQDGGKCSDTNLDGL
jgi:hypothetical protein